MTKSHRWTSDTDRLRPDGERIEKGDEFDPTDHERRAFGDRMELLPTCEGAGGECSRTVDEPGEYCYQHPLEDTD
jgi:hypothetical protein